MTTDVLLRQRIARVYWRLSRWTVVSEPLPRDGAGILVAAPHTSNWDFVHMLAISAEAGISVKYLGKKALFRPPFGWLMRALGGIPVDRSAPQGLVEDLTSRVRAGERFYLVVTPEGTRSAGTYWKSGFYRIARQTGLPITLAFLDVPSRTVGWGPTFHPTGDVSADMDVLREFYADKTGFNPEGFTPPRLREEDRA